jgi:AbrB family looped-hinge helix DNA binding protein
VTTAIISAKGWVVIPKEIRQRYGLKKGDRVHFVDYGGQIALVPALKDPIHDLRGMFKGGPSLTEALLEERRKDLQREEEKIKRSIGSGKAHA